MKQLFFKNNYLLLLCIISLLVTCKKNPQPTERIIQNKQENVAEHLVVTEPFRPVILGEKLENPFSVENMKKALNELNQQSPVTLADAGISQSVDINDEDIYTTDLYVRFLPADSAQYATLQQDTSLILFNTPLDYEIKQSGDYYKDSSVTGEYTWLYTTVKPDYVAPAGIKYEVLSKLFIPEHSKYYVETPIEEGTIVANTGSGKSSRKVMDPNFVNTLLIQSFVLTGNEKQLGNGVVNNNNKVISRTVSIPRNHRFLWIKWTTYDIDYYPDGYITVNTPNGTKPVKGVVVKFWKWFYTGSARTNAIGYYESTTKFDKSWIGNQMNYTVVFDGYANGMNWTLDKTWFGALCIGTSTYNAGFHHPNGFSMTFYDNSGSWAKCVINNAIYDYVSSNIYSYGISRPPANMQIAMKEVRNTRDEVASTPLLRNHVNISLYYLMSIPGIALTPFAYILVGWGMPDMIFQYTNRMDRYNNIVSTAWHELTHASQVQRLKQEKGYWWTSDYWSANVYQQASNGENPYGQKGGSRWQQIALSEGWGYFMEWTMARDILGWNSLHDIEFNKNSSIKPKINNQFPTAYAEMFYNLQQIGCSYGNMEKCLATYSLSGYKDNLIRYYPHLQNQIRTIILPYE